MSEWNNTNIRERRNYKGEFHNENGPAFEEFSDDDPKLREAYYINGKLHNENGPAKTKWTERRWVRFLTEADLYKESEQYYINGKLHNENGPASISWYKDGQKWAEEYYVDGKLHNTNGPASIEWYEVGQKKYEKYYINGKFHNTNGSAVIRWFEDGQKWSEEYYVDGKYHNLNGPAVIKYKNNKRESELYFINEVQLNEEIFFQLSKENLFQLSREGEINIVVNKYTNKKLQSIKCIDEEGGLHNTKGPAIIYYDKEGNKMLEEHCVYGELLYRRKVFDDKPIVSYNRVVMSLLNNRIVMSCLRALAQ